MRTLLARRADPNARAYAATVVQFELLLSTSKPIIPLCCLLATGQVSAAPSTLALALALALTLTLAPILTLTRTRTRALTTGQVFNGIFFSIATAQVRHQLPGLGFKG